MVVISEVGVRFFPAAGFSFQPLLGFLLQAQGFIPFVFLLLAPKCFGGFFMHLSSNGHAWQVSLVKR